jgi:hypothetical protein
VLVCASGALLAPPRPARRLLSGIEGGRVRAPGSAPCALDAGRAGVRPADRSTSSVSIDDEISSSALAVEPFDEFRIE